MHAALKAVCEMPFTASAGVDLGFDDEIVAANFPGGGFGLGRSVGDFALWAGDTELIEKLLGLVFVDIHDALRMRAQAEW